MTLKGKLAEKIMHSQQQVSSLGNSLDPCLSKAVLRLGFVAPTIIQSKVLPLALQGRDILVWFLFLLLFACLSLSLLPSFCLVSLVLFMLFLSFLLLSLFSAKLALARARHSLTCFLFFRSVLLSHPLSVLLLFMFALSSLSIQHVLLACDGEAFDSSSSHSITAVVLVPTRELCQQVFDQLTPLLLFCHDRIKAIKLCADLSLSIQASQLRGHPHDIVVATSGRLGNCFVLMRYLFFIWNYLCWMKQICYFLSDSKMKLMHCYLSFLPILVILKPCWCRQLFLLIWTHWRNWCYMLLHLWSSQKMMMIKKERLYDSFIFVALRRTNSCLCLLSSNSDWFAGKGEESVDRRAEQGRKEAQKQEVEEE